MHFSSAGLPDGGITLNRAAIDARIPDKGDGFGSSLVVVRSNIASDSNLAVSDFDLYGSTELAPRKAFSSFTAGSVNRIELNSAGLANVSQSGTSKFFFLVDRDFDNSEPSEVGDRFLAVDTSESSNQMPSLLVEYRAASTSSGAVSGTVAGTNLPSGSIRVFATPVSNAGNGLAVLVTPGAYSIASLSIGESYHVTAYVDENGNGLHDPLEWIGVHPGNPVVLTANQTGIDITISAPVDSDNDGLPDAWKIANGLAVGINDALLDKDGDGLNNAQELWLRLGANDTDSDDDGLSDFAEVNIWGTNPLLADSDSDGLPDKWESDNGLDPRRDDADEDRDFDFVSNRDEYNGGTNPTKANSGDSDNDGVSDFVQRNNGQSTWRALYDRNDRLLGTRDARGASFAYGYDGNGNPIKQAKLGFDSDGDGLSDLWEFANGLDPNSPNGSNGRL